MTVAAKYSTLKALSISGVTTSFDAPPNIINNADLPCKYVRLSQGENAVALLDNKFGLKQYGYEIVIVLEAVTLSDNVTNQNALLTLVDNAIPALEAITDIINYSFNIEIVRINEALYWGCLIDCTMIEE